MIKPTDGAAKTDEKIDDKVLRRKELDLKSVV